MTSSGETSPLSVTPTATPGSSQAPKFGTLIPNRVFVGGIPANMLRNTPLSQVSVSVVVHDGVVIYEVMECFRSKQVRHLMRSYEECLPSAIWPMGMCEDKTQEHELKAFFSQFGAVKDCKIIVDRAGVSKGYGFVTFETLEDAEKIIKKEADNLVFNGRKLNIGPAIRKQQAYPRMDLTPGAIYLSNGGIPYTYQNGMAVFHTEYQHLPAQPQPAATYPGLAVQPQASYIPYVHQSPPAATPATWAGASQWRWTPQSPTSAAVGTQPYIYPVQQAVPEMVYAHQPHYFATPEMSEVEATAAAAAAAAEGSMAMEPNMYAEKLKASPPAAQSPAALTATKASPIVYGKRPGAALVAPPRKIMNTAHSSSIYSTRLTPTPPPFKYERSMLAATAFNGTNFGIFVRDHAGAHALDPSASVVQLTPPKTPEVK